MSTRSLCPSLVAPALALVLAGACAGREQQAVVVDPGRVLEAKELTTLIVPGLTRPVAFFLHTPAGMPIVGETVTFTIVDDPGVPGVEAQGATLVATTDVTDENGIASAQVTAGQYAVFRVRATDGDAEAEAEIVVSAAMLGTVDVAPFFPPGSRAAALATTVEVLFYLNTACADISLLNPPAPARTVRTVSPAGGVATYDFVDTSVSDAVVGRASDGRGAIQALGCVDLPGSALITGGTVQLALPLADASPDPVGTFAVTSQMAFSPPLPAAAAMAAPWRDLSDCPLDPAQIWLDCTTDALSGAVPGDPVDCVPATGAGAEGPLGDDLAARRGAFLLGPDGQTTACRGARDGGGATSLDALLMGRFGSPLPAAVVELPAIADTAAHLLDAITVRSQLDVRASGSDGVFEVTHTLQEVVFGSGSSGALKEVVLMPLGLPALVADTTATIQGGTLAIAAHGMTLRLGSAARVAFGTLALAQRTLPSDTSTFLTLLLGLARSDDGTLGGCAEMDIAVCAQVGRPTGCLKAACTAGISALVQRLNAGFAAADGTGLDFFLVGSAPLIDTHGTGFADRLGDLEASPPAPGTWSADLRPQAGRIDVTAQWEAVRTGN
jgi:hypothetical protein